MAVIFLLLTAAMPLSYSWDFSGGSSALNDRDENSRTFTSDGPGIRLTASAWSENNSNVFERVYLGYYDNGLGVTNNVDDGSGSNNRHTIDNIGKQDFVVFQFEMPVVASALTLVPFTVSGQGPDSDFQAWVGLSFADFSLNKLPGLNFDRLVSQLGLTRLDENLTSSSSTRTADLALGGNPSDIFGDLLILRAGADSADGPSSREDGFKIRTFYAEAAPVPEPTTMILVGTGLAGLAGFRRRKTTRKS